MIGRVLGDAPFLFGSDKVGIIMRWVDAGLLNREVLISSWDGFPPEFPRDFPALALEKFFPGL